MKIFVCEFITGGGLAGQDLPRTLAREGDMMLQAVLKDLVDAGCAELITTRDHRVSNEINGVNVVVIHDSPMDTWGKLVADNDAVLVIAPETGDALLELTHLAASAGCKLLGCEPESIEATGSKRQCNRLLREAGVPVPGTYDPETLPDRLDQPLIMKPDKGAGSDGIHFLDVDTDKRDCLSLYENGEEWIIEAFTGGVPASLTLYCNSGMARILAVNRQLFRFDKGRGQFNGVVVNEFFDRHREMQPLANRILETFPGLHGYVGVDLVLTDKEAVVIEVNPRLTTAYAGLRRSLGYNPGQFFLNQQDADIPDPMTYTPVRIALDDD
ncbi:MAG: ATP-grasp domain-containing protein [Gammaproteobacteria bacterium]|nr:ATP-grasp domain-containing protein [Gammaproteobacteria bacterium]